MPVSLHDAVNWYTASQWIWAVIEDKKPPDFREVRMWEIEGTKTAELWFTVSLHCCDDLGTEHALISFQPFLCLSSPLTCYVLLLVLECACGFIRPGSNQRKKYFLLTFLQLSCTTMWPIANGFWTQFLLVAQTPQQQCQPQIGGGCFTVPFWTKRKTVTIYFIWMHVCLSAYMNTRYVQVPEEARRGCWVSWNWTYGWFWCMI